MVVLAAKSFTISRSRQFIRRGLFRTILLQILMMIE
jgi:hypothetical protein